MSTWQWSLLVLALLCSHVGMFFIGSAWRGLCQLNHREPRP